MKKVSDKNRLEHILESIDNVLEFTKNVSYEDFVNDKVLNFAVIKNIEIVGEAGYRISKAFKENHSNVNWAKILEMRHTLTHNDYLIENSIAWEIVQKDLLPLREQIQTLYNNEK